MELVERIQVTYLVLILEIVLVVVRRVEAMQVMDVQWVSLKSRKIGHCVEEAM